MSDDSDWAPPEASAADWAPPEAQEDADRESFKSAVGRYPGGATELQNFKAHPENWAGYKDPNRAPVALSDVPGGLATAATGMLASVPAGIRQGAGLLSGWFGGETADEARQAGRDVADYWTRKPKTPGEAQMAQDVGDVATMGAGGWMGPTADAIDPTGTLKQAGSDVLSVAQGVAGVAGIPALARGAASGLTRVGSAMKGGEIPAGTQFAADGTAISTPLPQPAAGPAKAAPGPVTPEELQTSPQRLPDPPAAEEPAAATQAPLAAEPAARGVPVPGKPHIRPKAQPAELAAAPEPAPEPAAGVPKGALTDEEEIASGQPADAAEQQARAAAIAQLHEDTGIPAAGVRPSALTGDYRESGTDYQLGELGDPTMRAQLDKEQALLKTGAAQQVEQAGGTVRGTTPEALDERGAVIDKALQGVHDWFDKNIRSTYAAADAAAGGRPMADAPATRALLADPTEFAGTVEGEALHRGAVARAQKLGLLDQNGAWQPATVAQAERFRQWLGQNYTPRTGSVIGKLKDALDDDVARHGGGGIYDASRALRYKRDQMLKGTKGIEQLLPTKNPDGSIYSRPVALGKMADHVANMDREQFSHVMNVLHDASKLDPELARNNAAAINEIRRHIAERLQEAGLKGEDKFWNSRAYHDKLNSYATKLPAIFSPEAVRRFQTLRDAGNALRVNKRYGGAAKQLMQAGGLREKAGERIGGAVEGALTGALGPVGGAMAEMTGAPAALRKGIGRVVAGNAEARQAAKVGERIQPLADVIAGGKQRGGPRMADFQNNASGESAASVEAQNWVRDRAAAGVRRFRLDADGVPTPLNGIEGRDPRSIKGQPIVDVDKKGQITPIDRGELPQPHLNGLIARSKAMHGLGAPDRTLGDTLFGGKQRGGPKASNPYDNTPARSDPWNPERQKNDRLPKTEERGTNPYDSGGTRTLGDRIFGGRQRGGPQFTPPTPEKLPTQKESTYQPKLPAGADVSPPTIKKLADSFDAAIEHHLSLPPKERVANSKAAKAKMAEYGVKNLFSKNMKMMKTEKGIEGQAPIKMPDGRGIETTGMALAPAYEEGKFTTCPNSASCKAVCLGKTSGGNFMFGGGSDLDALKGLRLAHMRATQAMLRDPGAFAVKLHDEVQAAKMQAEKRGNQLGVRLNVLSDINPRVHAAIIKAHPDVQFYDYTKNATNPIAPNHHYTYSSTGVSQPALGIDNPHQNWQRMRNRMDNGQNVTMAFSVKGKAGDDKLPAFLHDEETGKKYRVVDGDTHDFRPFDAQPPGQPGVVVGLRNKAHTTNMSDAAVQSKGFFVHHDPAKGDTVNVAPQKKPHAALDNDKVKSE